MRRYGHFVSFTFQFRLEQFLGLTLNGGSLQSPQFRVGAHEFDVKISRCSRANDAGTYAMFIGCGPLSLFACFVLTCPLAVRMLVGLLEGCRFHWNMSDRPVLSGAVCKGCQAPRQ